MVIPATTATYLGIEEQDFFSSAVPLRLAASAAARPTLGVAQTRASLARPCSTKGLLAVAFASPHWFLSSRTRSANSWEEYLPSYASILQLIGDSISWCCLTCETEDGRHGALTLNRSLQVLSEESGDVRKDL